MPDAHVDMVLRACNSALHLLADASGPLGLACVAAGEPNLPPVSAAPYPTCVAVMPIQAKREREADGSLVAQLALTIRAATAEAVKKLGPDLFAPNPRGPVVGALEKATPAAHGFAVTGMRGVPLLDAVAVTPVGELARAGEPVAYFHTLLVIEICCTP